MEFSRCTSTSGHHSVYWDVWGGGVLPYFRPLCSKGQLFKHITSCVLLLTVSVPLREGKIQPNPNVTSVLCFSSVRLERSRADLVSQDKMQGRSKSFTFGETLWRRSVSKKKKSPRSEKESFKLIWLCIILLFVRFSLKVGLSEQELGVLT